MDDLLKTLKDMRDELDGISSRLRRSDDQTYLKIGQRAAYLADAIAIVKGVLEAKGALEQAEQYTGNAALVAGSEKGRAEFKGYNVAISNLLALLKEVRHDKP